MKNLVGCLLILGVLCLGAGVAAWLFVYKPLSAMAADWGEAIDDFREVAELDSRIGNDEPFDEPQDGLLHEADFERFVAVQEHVAETAGAERALLEQKYEELRLVSEQGFEASQMGPGDFVMAVRDLAEVMRAAKAAQVEAMNELGFSIAEYRWVQREALAGLGVAVMPADVARLRDLDLKSLGELDELQSLRDVAGEVSNTVKAPEQTRELVAPYAEHKETWTRMALLGL